MSARLSRARQLAGKRAMGRDDHYPNADQPPTRTDRFGGKCGRFRIGSRLAKICTKIARDPAWLHIGFGQQRLRAALGNTRQLRLWDYFRGVMAKKIRHPAMVTHMHASPTRNAAA